MRVGLLQVALHLPVSHSLKEKRSVLTRLKAQVRGRFNVAIAEVDPNDTWQRATLGIATVGPDITSVRQVLRAVTEWFMLPSPLVGVTRVEEDYF